MGFDVLRFARPLARRVAASWRALRSTRWSGARARARGLPVDISRRWARLSRLKRYSLMAALATVAVAVTLGYFTWSGVAAAREARQAYRELQAEMSHLTPVDLIQANIYQSLEGRFQEAEEASGRARSRLGFLRAFGWLPVIGGRINEATTLLDMAFYQGRAGRNLATAYRAAITSPLADLPPDAAAAQISRILREVAPQLNQVREDLHRVAGLREKLGASGRGAGYGVLVDRYLPTIQTLAYLSLTSPEVIGHTYVLSRELSNLRGLTSDPLDVIANPEIVGRGLGAIAEQATALEESFDLVRRATEASTQSTRFW